MTDRSDSSKAEKILSRELFGRVLAGDPSAQQQFYDEALAAVYTIAEVLCRSGNVPADIIDDVVQDTFLTFLHQPAEKNAAIKNWRAWFHTVTRTRFLDNLRRRKIRKTIPLDAPANPGDPDGQTLAAIQPGGVDPAEEAIKREEKRERDETIERFVATLPKERAVVFRLYLSGLLQREIADETGHPINTVGVWIYRTKSSLAAWLEEPGRGRSRQ